MWVVMVTQQLLVKDVVSVTEYWHKEVVLCPYPLFLTGTINGIASALCFTIVFAMRIAIRVWDKIWKSSAGKSLAEEAWTEHFFTWPQFGMMLLTGLFEGFERGFQNKAFQYLGIATRTMLCSTGILFIMAIALPLGLESASWMKLVAVAVLVLGGCLQALGMRQPGATSTTGVVCVAISLVAGAMRWAAIQFVMHKTSEGKAMKPNVITKVKMLAFMKPMDCLFCYMLSWMWERADFTAVTSELVEMWFLLAGLIVCIVVCELVIVSRTSAVALGVVMVLMQIPMVLAGVVLAKESVTCWQLIGFAVCIVGAFVYFHTRVSEAAATPPLDSAATPPLDSAASPAKALLKGESAA